MWRKALIAIALLAVVAAGLWLWRFIAIDRCLDDGGGWDHDKNLCECSRSEMANASPERLKYCEEDPPLPPGK
ncbi:MAG: hypothetical protein HOP13_08050 [Alphaproteobacteria bacterium]|nr:hypothetical protein [Alphaproteobacteria bacterium]